MKLALDIAPHLRTKVMARILEVHEQIGSTNDRARDLARHGAMHGTAVVAHAQTKGRGQRGRTWFSPPFSGLYVSFVVRPRIAPRRMQALPLVAGVALRDAIGEGTELRWPNDLVAASDRRKIAGILVEAAADQQAIDYAVIGIGINLKTAAWPEAIRGYATSLEAACQKTVERGEVLAALALALEVRLMEAEEDLGSVLSAWMEHAAGIGETVTVEHQGAVSTGVLRGVAEDGALRLETAPGVFVSIHTGILTLPRSPPRPPDDAR